jgi:hypothetical protein
MDTFDEDTHDSTPAATHTFTAYPIDRVLLRNAVRRQCRRHSLAYQIAATGSWRAKQVRVTLTGDPKRMGIVENYLYRVMR